MDSRSLILLGEPEYSLDQPNYCKRLPNYDAKRDIAFYTFHQIVVQT
jgi:hypothetical protein